MGLRRYTSGFWCGRGRLSGGIGADHAEAEDGAKLAAGAGLRRIRLHDCRHSAISLLLAAGVPVVAVAGVMGHDPVVTQRIYAHMFEDDAVDAMATLDKVFRSV